jgi:hypothetical protein
MIDYEDLISNYIRIFEEQLDIAEKFFITSPYIPGNIEEIGSDIIKEAHKIMNKKLSLKYQALVHINSDIYCFGKEPKPIYFFYTKKMVEV